MIRKEAVAIIAGNIGKNPIVSANGFMSRDLFEANDKESNFYMIGSMGLASSIGLGIALKNPKKADLNKDGKLSDYEEKRGAAIEKNIKELDSSIPLGKDFTYDYEDIGQFYLEGFGRPHSLNNSELEALGKQIVDRLYDGNLDKAYNDLKNKGRMNEVELPTSIIQKFANDIKDPQGFAKAMLGIFNSIQDKEQKDYSKNQKFGRVLSYLKDIADDEAKEINEAPGSTLDLSQDDMDKLHQSGKFQQIL